MWPCCIEGGLFLIFGHVLARSSVWVSVCEREIITIFNILWHSNFIHVVRATHWKKNKTLLHFSQVLLCSLAHLLPRIFSCLPRSSRLSLSPSVSSLCPSACLSHSAAAVSILYSVCYFWMKPFSPCSQPVSFAEVRPQLADCGSIVAVLIHRESLDLAPKKEKTEKHTVAQERLLKLQMCCWL